MAVLAYKNAVQLILASYAVALIAFAAGKLGTSGSWSSWLVDLSVFSAVVWTTIVAFAVIRLRAKALWTLIGAPLALYYLQVVLLMHWACAVGGNCI